MNIFIETLKEMAQEFKELQQGYIDEIKEADLAHIAFMERVGSSADVQTLQNNLSYIADRYEEMRTINNFVQFCEAKFVL